MHDHEIYMNRCLQLASIAAGKVAPNPMVGAVLVHNGRIIGEGYHLAFGEPHAEVNCIASVAAADKNLIPESVLYVSLEPCAHHGKTPPCADLIIRRGIKKVFVGCRDPFVQADGKGIEKLKAAGIEVQKGVLEEDCRQLNKRFLTFHEKHRPYIVLKWAQTADGKIAAENKDLGLSDQQKKKRLLISNECSNRIVHKWRSEEMAILVGTNTALHDDPSLTTRLWPGNSPIRLVVDMELKLPSSLKLFTTAGATIVFNLHKHSVPMEKSSLINWQNTGTLYYQVAEDATLVSQIINACYHLNIQSVLVEGGASLLQSFIEEKAWDEARIICNEEMMIGAGLPAPTLQDAALNDTEHIFSDSIRYYKRN